ncbi:hypothetical protein Slu03_25450 [Sediminihabitans luteus]|nr:hypothetical protein Slu03_25450 [Sediminihabitans luteus]
MVDAPALQTRRALREAEAPASRPRRRPRPEHKAPIPTSQRWAPRAAVLSSLALATIAMPITSGLPGADGDRSPFADGPSGPSTLDVVAAASSGGGTSQYVAAAPRSARSLAAEASRSLDRSPLPGCDAGVRPAGTNGQLDPHALCDLWQDGESLRPDAAVSLAAMNEAYHARFGRDLCLVASYRTLSEQVTLSYTRAGFAARPGTSMHGWGLAIDLCTKETSSSTTYGWITQNAGTYGWENPAWAQRGGSGAYEPWHFEFAAGVREISGA